MQAFESAEHALAVMFPKHPGVTTAVTMVSKKSGQSFVYKLHKPRKSSPTFVSVQSQKVNGQLGMVFQEDDSLTGNYWHMEKSGIHWMKHIHPNESCARAFDWLYRSLKMGIIPDNIMLFMNGIDMSKNIQAA